MGASYSCASPSEWRPTMRTLGALFAGSAVTLSATLLHGGSLVLAGNEAESITESLSSPIVAEPVQVPQVSPGASIAGLGQAAPWTPGALPQWGSPLKDLPVHRAPVQEMPRQGSLALAPVATASTYPANSRPSTASSTAPEHDTGNASNGAGGSVGAAPQAANPPQDQPSDGLLSGVLKVTEELPE
jgi:hypothetical protein